MIRAAIIGVGRRGQTLVECTQGKTDRIRFTTGVARTPERAASFASRHGLALVNDYVNALADPSIDAVVLATPHTQHAEQVIAAARAGKHVFTDKPFALTRASAEAAAKACADAGRVLAVGFTWSLTTCMVNAQPTVIDYPQTSTERAELEGFADAIEGRAPYACPPDDAVHGVAVLEAIVKSAKSGLREPIE